MAADGNGNGGSVLDIAQDDPIRAIGLILQHHEDSLGEHGRRLDSHEERFDKLDREKDKELQTIKNFTLSLKVAGWSAIFATIGTVAVRILLPLVERGAAP